MEKKAYSREDIIKALKELDAQSEKPIGVKALNKKGISPYWVSKLFPEGVTELKRKYGLKLSPQEQPRSVDELLEQIDKVVSKLKKIPSWVQFRRETGIAEKTLFSRFDKHGKREVFNHYRKWLEKNKPKSKNIKLVNAYLGGQIRSKNIMSQLPKGKGSVIEIPKWPKVSRREYGAPLNFGSLIYEPINEQGVVFLFGIVSRRLGFSIEYIGTDFPDCEAKRYIGGARKRQQHVKIEFEFRSRDYDHPVEGCDIIVCWEDNWGKDCPLEVIELRSEIKKLRELPEFSRK